jgi:alpha-beta hydrolase superfamily lysophospholipase
MRFTSETTSNGIIERDFILGDVPGVLWSPASAAEPAPLVLIGHPGGLHKKAPGVVARATYYVNSLGFQVGAIDAPGHGDRPRSASDADWVEKIGVARRAGEPLGAIVSEFNAELAERAVPEWIAALDELLELPSVAAGPVGYSGMTVGTEIGARFIVADDRIGAAVLGGVFAFEPMIEVMRQITIPVQYLLAWDDPEIDRESTFILFDVLGSSEKTLHANAGTHRKVPFSETEDGGRFFARHLLAEAAG